MVINDYFRILGLRRGCTINDLKRAYRVRARQYHPDINPAPGATDMFIAVTEAYEFLLRNLNSINMGYDRAPAETEIQRQRTREKAAFYSRMDFENFTRTSTYRTTRIFDATTIIYGLIVSVIIIGLDIYSYTILKSQATSKEEEPSLLFMLLILAMGTGFFIFAYLNLLSFINNSRKRKK